MSYHPRIESRELASLCTTRCRASELWFINNRPLEEAILGYAAKYGERYSLKLYALGIEGNHIHHLAHYPKANRADFMRDFTSSTARAVPRYTPEYTGGRLIGRRYSQEFLPNPEDIEEYFFYIALQPIQDGLVERLGEYPGYNFFNDAVKGRVREFYVIDWTAYNDKKRFNPNLRPKDFRKVVYLKYERLPGYEGLSQKEYERTMREKLEERRLKIVKERYAAGKGFAGRLALKATPRGARPRSTKTSTSKTHRPRILSKCDETRHAYKIWYFQIYFEYRAASKAYREGDVLAEFPRGTYPPWRPLQAAA